MKRILALLLVFTLMIGTTNQISATAKASDISKHWAEATIQSLIDSGYITGFADGTFKPNQTISKGAFLTLLIKIMKVELSTESYYTDCVGHWSEKYVSAAVEAGLIGAVNDDKTWEKFNPDQAMTREAMAVILAKATGELGKFGQVPTKQFTDMKEVVQLNQGYIYLANSLGLINGYPNGTFKPKAGVTRAEACIVLDKFIKYGKQTSTSKVLDGETIYATYQNAIVKIGGTNSDGTWETYGSGCVIDKSGKVLTNYHVINDLKDLRVVFVDGTEKKVVSIANYSRGKDLAILTIESGDYDSIGFGNSRSLKMGETIYTLGYPLQKNLSISSGIISSFVNDGLNDQMIQLSAPISPGSSGGALINKYGELVGITTATMINGQNLNLAVPMAVCFDFFNEADNKLKTSQVTPLYVDLEKSGVNLNVGDIETFSIPTGKEIDAKVMGDLYVDGQDKFIGFDIDLEHKLNGKDDELFMSYYLVDDWNNEIYEMNRYVKLSPSGKTHITEVLDELTVDMLFEGSYSLFVYFEDELTCGYEIGILCDTKEQNKGFSYTAGKIVDYTLLNVKEGQKIVTKSTIDKNVDPGIGVYVEYTYGSTSKEDRYDLFQFTVTGPDEYIRTSYRTGYVEAGELKGEIKGLIDVVGADLTNGTYQCEVKCQNTVLTTYTFEVVGE